ncbi:MAG: helix-turn-helix domain-containing protein [Chloroflexi bacterium]|nr:helix-turn-helix domain-containing protein [Chloroflexota bacterium]
MNSCTLERMAEEAGRYHAGGEDAHEAEWASGRRVRRLRRHLGETQTAFADRLGTNQQTVSEWETGARQPRRMAQRLLHLVAEQAGYYDASDIGAPSTDEGG